MPALYKDPRPDLVDVVFPAVTRKAIVADIGDKPKISLPVAVPVVKPERKVRGGESAYMARGKKRTGKGKAKKKGGKAQQRVNVIPVPASVGGVMRMPEPVYTGKGNKLTVTHCEPFVVRAMTATAGSATLNYGTSPLIPSSCTFLSGVASNFGKWSWKKLRIFYVPACSTSTDGEISMGTYYDRSDAVTATFVQVAMMEGGVSFPPWGGGPSRGMQSISTTINCDDFDKPKYAYIGTTAFAALSATDQNSYCPVSLATATQGSNVAIAVPGRFWVEYTCQLLEKIVPGLNP
nr:MAG: putative coat protein [Tombusviridae sp.]